MISNKMRRGIYIHIPVCRQKCLYCDFYSVGERLVAEWDLFVSCVIREAEIRKEEFSGCSEATVYVGGGTPSLLPASAMRKMLNGVFGVLRSASPNVNISEVTVEVNPDDVTKELAI